jgi:hypothetical protein
MTGTTQYTHQQPAVIPPPLTMHWWEEGPVGQLTISVSNVGTIFRTKLFWNRPDPPTPGLLVSLFEEEIEEAVRPHSRLAANQPHVRGIEAWLNEFTGPPVTVTDVTMEQAYGRIRSNVPGGVVHRHWVYSAWGDYGGYKAAQARDSEDT